MKELDDISQEIAQLQRCVNRAALSLPTLTQTLLQVLSAVLEALETPGKLTVTSLFSKSEGTQIPLSSQSGLTSLSL